MCPTVSFGRAAETAVRERAFEPCSRFCKRRVSPLARPRTQVILQSLLLHKDLVAPGALDLSARIMVLVHVHAHRGLIGRGIIRTFRADIETLGRFGIGAALKFLSR